MCGRVIKGSTLGGRQRWEGETVERVDAGMNVREQRVRIRVIISAGIWIMKELKI